MGKRGSGRTCIAPVVGAAVWYLLGLACFALYARHRLVRSPEEDFALAQRKSQ